MPALVLSEGICDGRNIKRQRLDGPTSPRQETRPGRRSTIFAPFRTVGLVSSTAVPFTAVSLGKTTFQITTSVGRSLQTYDLRRGLNLVFITRPQTPGLITATVARGDAVFAAWTQESAPIEQRKKGIYIYKRGKKIDELPIPLDLDEDVVQLHVFGSWIIGCCATRIEVWSADSREHYASLLPPHGHYATGAILTGGLCSVPTYANKILAGREDGTIELWNISTAKLIYTIQPPSSDVGPVTAMQPTPALSLVAVAYMNGRISIQDIRLDKEVIALHAGQGDHSPITSISFRTDGLGAGPEGRETGVMATASYNSGGVIFWDLNGGGKKIGTLRGAHATPTEARAFNDGGISKIEFLSGQSILVTSGLDNALKSWIFDESPFSPIPRILHSRSGHAAPITTLNFLPSDADGADLGGKWLLSTSKDRSLWGWSLRRDGQSTELSQGNMRKRAAAAGSTMRSHPNSSSDTVENGKAAPITCLACCMNRDGGMGALPGSNMLWANAKQTKGKSTSTEQSVTGWESVVTGHAGDRFARTWFWGRKRAGRWTFETGDGAEVKSVAISPCGTFAVIGSAAGGIDMFNLQSGLHRQRFPPRITKLQAKRLEQSATSNVDKERSGTARGYGKHTAAVTGLVVDNLNRTVISSALDGKIKFWDFATGQPTRQIDWHGTMSALRMVYHRPNDLLAMACSDKRIRVLDIATKRLVRDLSGCTDHINDLCFSNDGKWILAALADSTVRVWDLPTGHLIDAIRLDSPCSALAFSNTGEFLALAQDESVGIDIWTNTTLFRRVPTNRIADDDVADIEGPTTSGEGGTTAVASAMDEDVQENETGLDSALAPVDHLSKDITTLSLVPKSRWQTLLHLDLIRERNKPKEPPKAPEKAPFFLPSLRQQSLGAQIDGANAAAEHDAQAVMEAERSRILKMDRSGSESRFAQLLRQGAHLELTDHLKTLAPSVADVEIRSLSAMPPYTEIASFVEALIRRLESRRDYELVQAWMSVLLRCHGEVLQEALSTGDGPALLRAFGRWTSRQAEEAARLGDLVGYCTGVVGFLRTSR